MLNRTNRTIEDLQSHIAIDGAEIEYSVCGSGRSLLFLHGGDGPDRSAPVIEHLATQFRVIYPSHPGFGRSGLPIDMTSVDDIAYAYLKFIRALQLNDLLVVGVSFGGWIAAELAIKTPSAITGVVLAGALGVKFGDPDEREILDLFSIPAYEQAAWLYSRPEYQSPDYASCSDERLRELARNHESFALFGWSPTLHSRKLKSRLSSINVPTLVLWGEQDRIVNVAYGSAYAAAIKGAKFTTIPNSGHYVHIEEPQAFCRAVSSFAAARTPTASMA